MSDDPRSVIRRLYGDRDGYTLSRDDEARVLATRSSPTYGEIMPTAAAHLIERLKLGRGDVFYDLGSGLGKLVLQVALSAFVERSVGIELVRSRHLVAQDMLARLRSTTKLRARRCQLRCSDFMRARLGDATVVYTCSTAFSTPFMNQLAARLARLRPGLRWVSTQDLDNNPWFALEELHRLDMSWRRRSKVHVYRLLRSRA